MRVYKRRKDGAGPWWFSFSHRGRPIRRSAGTQDRHAAQEYADRYRAELWRSDKLGERPAISWDVAALDWIEANSHLRALADRKDHLRWAQPELTGKAITTIDRNMLEKLGKKKAADGCSNATVNRHLASISAVLGHAVTKGWLTVKPRVPKRPEPEKRIIWATQEKAAKLVEALPEHLAAMAAFALATGLRRANVMGLEWTAVDTRRRIAWVHADEAKAGKTLPVPLNDPALAILQAQRGKHRLIVFPYRGRPMERQGAPVWRAACKKAGLKNFRWHDLRHTWASWHVQNGTPLPVLQELGGWASLTMVMRYAHLAPSHVASYAGNAGLVQNRSHAGKSAKQKKVA